ncbi:MAG: hypothetical protein ACOX7F_05600 [Eubacteriales bacterium]
MNWKESWQVLDVRTRQRAIRYIILIICCFALAWGGRIYYYKVFIQPRQQQEQQQLENQPARVSMQVTRPEYAQRLTVDKQVRLYELPFVGEESDTLLEPYTLVEVLGDVTVPGADQIKWVQVTASLETGTVTGYLPVEETVPFVEGMEALVQHGG